MPKETKQLKLLSCILGLPSLQVLLTTGLWVNTSRWQCPTWFTLKSSLHSELNSQDTFAVRFCSCKRMQISNKVPNLVPSRTKPKHSSFGAELENYSDFHVNVIMNKQIKMQSLKFSFKIKTLENHIGLLVKTWVPGVLLALRCLKRHIYRWHFCLVANIQWAVIFHRWCRKADLAENSLVPRLSLLDTSSCIQMVIPTSLVRQSSFEWWLTRCGRCTWKSPKVNNNSNNNKSFKIPT